MSIPADRADDLEIALAAAREAGRRVLEHFGRDKEVRFKGPEQPVTEADLAADRALREVLTGGRPDYGWLSEESADTLDRLERSRVWVVDPIDGTNSFIEGRPEFVISIGLVEHGSPVVAALLNPVTEEMYHAVRGGGAFRNGVPIEVAPAPAQGAAPVLLASRSEIAAGGLEPYRARWAVTPLGSTAYRMLKVADGTGHAFISPGVKREWDVCGAALVVEEAGGTVLQATGDPLRFNQRLPSVQGIVAAGRVDIVGADLPGAGG